jgi:hypothetical protein
MGVRSRGIRSRGVRSKRVRKLICGVVWVLVAAGGAGGQQGNAAGVPTSPAEVLRSMAARAGAVFVGSVTRIVPEGGTVEIDFKVQQPLLGVSAGSYTVHEWGGRWTGSRQRYRVGQRAMFFLHAPNASGLSSPVDGMTGVIPMIETGQKASEMVDLRWVGTRVQRPVGSQLATVNAGAMTLSDAARVVANWQVKTAEPVMYPMPGGTQPRPGPVAVDRGHGPDQSNQGHQPLEEQVNDQR